MLFLNKFDFKTPIKLKLFLFSLCPGPATIYVQKSQIISKVRLFFQYNPNYHLQKNAIQE